MLQNKQKPARPQTQSVPPQVVATVRVAGSVGDIQMNPDTNRIYFVRNDASVGVLDGRTNRIIADVKVGEAPAFLAVNPQTNRIYSTNFRDGTVSVIHGQSNRVVTTVRVGLRPFGIGVNRRTNRIYVANLSGSIAIIDGSSNRVIRTLQAGGSPALLSVHERTNRVYVSNVGNDTVSVIDGYTQTITSAIRVGRNPIFKPAIIPGTNRIYVASNVSRFLSVIDGGTDAVIRHIPLGRRQGNLIVSPRAHQIYASSAQQEGAGKLFVISGKTNEVITTLAVPTFPTMFFNPATHRLFVGDAEGTRLFVFDGRTHKRIALLRTGLSPGSMALNSRTNCLYVGNDGAITVIHDSK